MLLGIAVLATILFSRIAGEGENDGTHTGQVSSGAEFPPPPARSTQPSSQPPGPANMPPHPSLVFIAAENRHVRHEPFDRVDTKNNIICKTARDQQFSATARTTEGDWLRINLPSGDVGWIYVKEKGAVKWFGGDPMRLRVDAPAEPTIFVSQAPAISVCPVSATPNSPLEAPLTLTP
jgi:hypothetical protein